MVAGRARELDEGLYLGFRETPPSLTAVGLLSTRDHPLLPYVVDGFRRAPEIAPILILDRRGLSRRSRAVVADRIGGAFPARELDKEVTAVTVADHNDRACRDLVTDRGLRLLVNAGTPRRLTVELLESSPLGVLNVHPGILPKYRGANACEWAILNDDPIGVTAHFMDGELDSGPIIFSRVLSVERGQSYRDVRVALYRLWLATLVEATAFVLREGLQADVLPPQPPSPLLRPMSDELLELVKDRLEHGAYVRSI